MKKSLICIVSCIFIWVALGVSTSAQVQDKKAVDPLALNEAENKALDGFVGQSQELAGQEKKLQEAIGKAAEELRIVVKEVGASDKAIAGAAARFILLLDQNDVIRQKQGELNKEVNTWLTAVKNRLKCEECQLDLDGRKLTKKVENK